MTHHASHVCTLTAELFLSFWHKDNSSMQHIVKQNTPRFLGGTTSHTSLSWRSLLATVSMTMAMCGTWRAWWRGSVHRPSGQLHLRPPSCIASQYLLWRLLPPCEPKGPPGHNKTAGHSHLIGISWEPGWHGNYQARVNALMTLTTRANHCFTSRSHKRSVRTKPPAPVFCSSQV